MGQNGIKSLSLKAVHIVSLVCPDPNAIVLYYLLVFGALCFFFPFSVLRLGSCFSV